MRAALRTSWLALALVALPVSPPGAAAQTEPPAVRVVPPPPLSRFDAGLVRSLRRIRSRSGRRADDVFMKVGDSSTVSRGFLTCLARDEDLVLHGRDRLRPTLAHFRHGRAGRRDPFRRQSLAAAEGWSARHVLTGHPSPLIQEVRAIRPRFAFVMNGGNDVEGRDDRRYARRMLRIVRTLMDNGVVPILNSLPPRPRDPETYRWVRRYNGVSWAIARALRVPYLDYHQVMAALPRMGLARDGVHPNVLIDGSHGNACDFSPEGLTYGHNARNLLALEALDRLRRTVVEGEGATERGLVRARGEGTWASPRQIHALPFAEIADTRDAPDARIATYPPCADADEGGAEVVYRLRVRSPLRVRARAYPLDDADIDLHLLRGRPEGSACVARGDRELEATIGPGTWWLTADSFAGSGAPREGEYLLLVEAVASPASD
ncbi:MAG: SGNH/GDSL hydrolase family protein [Sandaracinaceae bacterium]